MDHSFIIEGKIPARGEVRIGGSEDIATLALILSLLTDGKLVIKNIPLNGRITGLLQILQFLGSVVEQSGTQITIDSTQVTTKVVPPDQIYSSSYDAMLLGVLSVKFGRAAVKFDSPLIDPELKLHLDLLSELLSGGLTNVDGYTTSSGTVKRDSYTLPASMPSLTLHALLLSAVGTGKFTLKNVVVTSQVDTLVQLLHQMGVEIEYQQDSFVITRKQVLTSTSITIPSDMYETAFWTACTLLTGGEITMESVSQVHCAPMLSKIEQFNIRYKSGEDRLHVWHEDEQIEAVNIALQPSKGIDIRVSRIIAAISTKAHGHSRFLEQELKVPIWTEEFLDAFGLHGSSMLNEGASELNIFGPTVTEGGTIHIHRREYAESALLLALTGENPTTLSIPFDLFSLYHDFSAKLAEVGLHIKPL